MVRGPAPLVREPPLLECAMRGGWLYAPLLRLAAALGLSRATRLRFRWLTAFASPQLCQTRCGSERSVLLRGTAKRTRPLRPFPPQSLALAHMNVDGNDTVILSPWTETDFRCAGTRLPVSV